MQANDEIRIVGDDPETGIEPDLKNLIDQIDLDTSLVMVQYPDFFGRIIDYKPLIEAAHAQGALVAVVANPTALALLLPLEKSEPTLWLAKGNRLAFRFPTAVRISVSSRSKTLCCVRFPVVWSERRRH